MGTSKQRLSDHLERKAPSGRGLCVVANMRAVDRQIDDVLIAWAKTTARMPALRGKVLGCWCHPHECHGHVIAEIVDQESARGAP
jgi:hypothetical protein